MASNILPIAKIARRSDLSIWCFFILFSVVGTTGRPRELQDSEETSQDGTREPPRAFQKMRQMFDSIVACNLCQTWPQTWSNNYQKTIQLITPTERIRQFLGPKVNPEVGNLGESLQQAEPARVIFKAIVSKKVSRWLKMAPSTSR